MGSELHQPYQRKRNKRIGDGLKSKVSFLYTRDDVTRTRAVKTLSLLDTIKNVHMKF